MSVESRKGVFYAVPRWRVGGKRRDREFLLGEYTTFVYMFRFFATISIVHRNGYMIFKACKKPWCLRRETSRKSE